eukprot:scaffold381821_cov15-Prasinocladus_malaysianus.AAC.1
MLDFSRLYWVMYAMLHRTRQKMVSWLDIGIEWDANSLYSIKRPMNANAACNRGSVPIGGKHGL